MSKIIEFSLRLNELQNVSICGILISVLLRLKGGVRVETRKLLIADGTEEFRIALCEVLKETYQVHSCRDGKEALALLRSFHPDILVLDLMLPELDGISLLQSAAAEGICPMVLATTRFLNDYVLESANALGVGYVMVKPCDIRATVARIRDLTKRLCPNSQAPLDPNTYIANLLLTLGVPTKLHGYAYLRQAILLMARHPGQSITKELYPDVGAACNSDKTHVERSIRSAIATAWSRRDDQVWQKYFQADAQGSLPRPTNAAFISRLAETLHLYDDSEKL